MDLVINRDEDIATYGEDCTGVTEDGTADVPEDLADDTSISAEDWIEDAEAL